MTQEDVLTFPGCICLSAASASCKLGWKRRPADASSLITKEYRHTAQDGLQNKGRTAKARNQMRCQTPAGQCRSMSATSEEGKRFMQLCIVDVN